MNKKIAIIVAISAVYLISVTALVFVAIDKIPAEKNLAEACPIYMQKGGFFYHPALNTSYGNIILPIQNKT